MGTTGFFSTRRAGCWIACFLVIAALDIPARAEDKELAVFDGKDLQGWRAPTGDWLVVKGVKLDSADPQKFVPVDGEGVMLNGRRRKNLEYSFPIRAWRRRLPSGVLCSQEFKFRRLLHGTL